MTSGGKLVMSGLKKKNKSNNNQKQK